MCVSGSCRTSQSLCPPTSILKFTQRPIVTGFHHVPSPDGLNNTLLSWGCVLGVALAVGILDRTFHRQEWGWEASDYWGAAHRSVFGQVLSMTSSNNDQVAERGGVKHEACQDQQGLAVDFTFLNDFLKVTWGKLFVVMMYIDSVFSLEL